MVFMLILLFDMFASDRYDRVNMLIGEKVENLLSVAAGTDQF